MELSACGLICNDCQFFGKECNGCISVTGKPFWAAEIPVTGTCPLYYCAINLKGYKNCGDCAELPCQMFINQKDPNTSDAEHKKSISIRVKNLRGE